MGETQTIGVPPATDSRDTPEYQQQMVDKVEHGTVTADNPAKETLLAGKYKTEEDLKEGLVSLMEKRVQKEGMEAVYKDLERKLGEASDKGGDPSQKKQDEALPPEGSEDSPSAEDKPNSEDQSGDELPTQEELDKQVEESEKKEAEEKAEFNKTYDLDYDKFNSSYMENGELTEADYAELAEKGIPKSLVDAHIAGLKAQGTLIANAMFDEVGGADKYDEMIAWASTGLTPEEAIQYNAAISTNSVETGVAAVKMLKAKYEAANGVPPKQVVAPTASSSGGEGGDIYSSVAELVRDQKNPQYKKDPVYRAEVMAKLKRSKIL